MLCEAQKRMLLDFMNEHEELRHGKFTTTFTYKSAQQLWEKITLELNSVPNGGQKDWKKWRKTWQDMKKNAKSKNAEKKKYESATGGGPSSYKTLSSIDTVVLEMISPVQTDGLSIGETPIEFSFPEDELEETADNTLPSRESEDGGQVLVLGHEPTNVQQEVETVEVENTECIEEEHRYNLTYPTSSKTRRKAPKKMTKTSRLQSSLQLSQNHFKSMTERNEVLAEYYKNKILVENRKIRIKLTAQRRANIWWKHLTM